MECKRCGDNKVSDVPFMVHEQDMARLERSQRRAWITAILLAACLLLSNTIWIFSFQQKFEKKEYVQYVEHGCAKDEQEDDFV